jgi:N4-gp56 family major capsid protein
MAIANIFNVAAGANKLYVTHLNKRAVNALYGQAVLYEQGDPKPLPGGSGTTMNIPKYVGADNISALTEGTLLAPTSAPMAVYSGTVSGFGEVRAYSDFLMAVNEIPQFISDEINDMVMYARKKLDEIAIGVLSGSNVGKTISPDGSTAATAVTSVKTLKQRALFDANSTLAAANAQPYADGTWHGVFHPNQIHDLFVSTSGLNTGNMGAGYMEDTDIGAKKLERASIGILGNVKVYQSTWGSQAITSSDTYFSGGGGGYKAFIMGPGAFAKVDLASARLKTYWNPAKASTYDTIEQVSTAGVKFYATAVAMDTGTQAAPKRLVKVTSGGSTF